MNQYPLLHTSVPSVTVTSLTKEQSIPYMPSLTTLYKNVFSESSWQEGYKCTSCGKKSSFSKSPNKLCTCGTTMEDFYSDKEVYTMLNMVYQKTTSRVYIILENNTPIAFSWGWISSFDDINKEKLSLTEAEAKECKEYLEQTYKKIPNAYYYLSETGVDIQYRGKKLSSLMLNTLLEDLTQSNAECIIIRTSLDSALSQQLQKNNFQLLFTYNDSDKKVLYYKFIKL